MNRRSAALGAVLALSLTALPVLTVTAAAAASGASTSDAASDDAAQALSQLRQDADGPVKVARDADGTVTSLSSTDGSAMLDSDASTPAGAVKQTLADYGDAVGIDGDDSKAVVTKTLDSSTGGSVVRAQQTVDGLPVFGGQVVMSLDNGNDVTSVTSATTAPDTAVPAPVVAESVARSTALGLTARNNRVAARALTVVDVGRRVFDPSLVGANLPSGTEPVWQFTVSNGSDVRETVLVGTTRGEVALAYNDVPEINRRICDNNSAHTIAESTQVPVCSTPALIEGGSGSSVTDVNDAYENLRQVSVAYDSLDGIDLTDEIGLNVGGTKSLQATVRWCYSDTGDCPYDNAFWDGRQMVFGAGYAGANDVVGHELTHGYVDKTSQLFYFHEAGSINESVADTIGEIVDHRNGGAADGWKLGEDLPGGAPRNMANPTAFGQPDSTQSSHYDGSDISDGDQGAVHQNDGVGNKTAYLISQGGTFGGQTITGIDTGDPGDTRTGRLYLETIPRLTSGANWVQYGQTLISTCQQLVTADASDDNPDHPFTSANCTAVTKAVAATKLLTQPVSEAKQVAVSCPTATTQSLLARDDDGIHTLGLSTSSPLWVTGPDDSIGLPRYAVSGTESRFAIDPDPSLGDPASGTLISGQMTLPTTGPSYLNFHHSYAFDWVGRTYYDGGQVLVQKLSGSTWQTVNGLSWTNGPTRHIIATGGGFTGFGGDSHGFGSSQVNLSPLAGQTVRVVFQVAGDSKYYAYGWWLDDIRLYACSYDVASAPASSVAAASASAVRVGWSAPPFVGSNPITGYQVTSSTGKVWNLASTARSLIVGGLNPGTNVTFRVAAVTAGGTGVPGAAAIYATGSSLGSSAAKVKKNKPFRLTAIVVRRGTSARVASVPVVLQKKVGSSWRNLASGATGSAGTKVWSVKQKKATYYRVVTTAHGPWWGSASAARLVKKK